MGQTPLVVLRMYPLAHGSIAPICLPMNYLIIFRLATVKQLSL